MSYPRCPKCKGASVRVLEFGTICGASQLVLYGKVIEDNEGDPESYDPTSVEGECTSCKHRWTFKGANQIRDVTDKSYRNEIARHRKEMKKFKL